MSNLWMISLLLVLAALAFQSHPAYAQPNVCKVIETYSKRKCAEFETYGCACGANKTGIPIDGVDTCCSEKKLCFERNGCNIREDIKVNCTKHCVCNSGKNPHTCAFKACRCNIEMGRCLARYKFNKAYARYNYKKCRFE
ncbi:phospholipase A2 A2-hormotoxin-Apt1a-like [Physella acuta]|uniref:phospholipase A2 A2-hormotoxin-Apt1a-like n=1 Tax=Physella acuta TaxID=109671 RepID=UPI0027DE858B|nr:phospholipase A2 A2-hormotoxin-Apt1a-like [Physella acuta]